LNKKGISRKPDKISHQIKWIQSIKQQTDQDNFGSRNA